ncbi:Anaphase-promoting complex subunit 4 [Zea mays]|uniref:Anaphase-promoting complex subunit 4 n=1 Tax=Zea mays TaxID=4577 RepID=A0A1D6QCT4_MAIZE|nr:Anaphase-promoting complex subunit 4 [Zea mays]
MSCCNGGRGPEISICTETSSHFHGNACPGSEATSRGNSLTGHHARAAAFRAHEIVSRHPDVCRPCRLDFIVVIWKASKIVHPFLIVLCYTSAC